MRGSVLAVAFTAALVVLAGCGGSNDEEVVRLQAEVTRLETQVEQLQGVVGVVNGKVEALEERSARTRERVALIQRNTEALQGGLYDLACLDSSGGRCHVPCSVVSGVCVDSATGEFIGRDD
jgi:outer membrane murein-binding lipoprotein Lpp